MDSWCPNCGYVAEPGTRFCGGCGQQLAAQGGAPDAQAPTLTVQSSAASVGGYQASSAFFDSTAPLPAPTPLAPPSADTRSPWPPPPAGVPSSSGPPPPSSMPPPPPASGAHLALPPPSGQPGGEPPRLSDTMERMLRPQGLFQSHLPKPVEWPQPQPQPYPPTSPPPPAPGGYGPGAAYPPPAQYPQAGQQYPQQGPYPAGGQYPAAGPYPPPGQYPPQPGPYPPPGPYAPTGTFQQAAPPGWAPAPTTAIPPAGTPAPFPGTGQPGAGYPAGGQYPPGPQFPPGGQYPQGGQYPGAPGGAPYGGQFGGGQQQFGQEQFPPGQFGPAALVGPEAAPPGDESGKPRLAGKLPFKLPQGRNRLIPVAVAGILIIIVVAGLVLSSQGGSSNGTSPAAAATQSASAASGSGLTQEQAATALSGLLAQSGTDHSDVNAAVTDVQGCGGGLANDAKEFTKAAANRRALLAKLARLPGRSALSAQMLAELTSAWQASATVDADLAKWAASEAGHCRKGSTTKSADYTATIPFDSKATNGKTEFVGLWNPLAKKDSLPTYQAAQL